MEKVFNIATFNIWKNCGKFPSRIYNMAKDLPSFDCICLQEDYHSKTVCSSDIINEKLNYYKSTISLRLKKRDGILSCSNLTILSKFKPEFMEKIYFNEFEDDERGALIIKLTVNEKSILVVNTHLSNLSKSSRVEQIETIMDYIASNKKDITILCGDMNSTPKAKELNKIYRYKFSSVNEKETHESGLILDYIFFKSNFKLTGKSDVILKDYSDHYCLANRFHWE